MSERLIHQRGTTLVRRLRLAPGEATPWHRDPFHRITVIVSGDVLAIEYRDGGPRDRFRIKAGQTDWDEPTERIHRAVNVGEQVYEEVTIFLLDDPNAVPQPHTEEHRTHAAGKRRRTSGVPDKPLQPARAAKPIGRRKRGRCGRRGWPPAFGRRP